MTPVEIEWALAAFAARERRALERIDLLAWLTGRYVALGVNAPGRYPKRPDCLRTTPAKMSAEEMKQAFKSIARQDHP